MEQQKHEVTADYNDLMFVFCAAMRYALGRSTYATSIIPDIFKSNLGLMSYNDLALFVKELEQYEKDRVTWNYKDGQCDYDSWMNLKAILKKEMQDREE